jgi:hypothetical protein
MLSPAAHLRSISSPDGAAILDIKHESLITLNPTGNFVWERIQHRKTLIEIVRELASDTGVDVRTIERDVRAFVDELKARHLIEG